MQFLKVASLFGLFAIAACGSSYEDKCKDACEVQCDSNNPRSSDDIATCKTSCEEAAEQAKAVDCEDEAEKVQSCNDDNSCDDGLNAACADETAAYSRCKASFCFDNVDSQYCAAN